MLQDIKDEVLAGEPLYVIQNPDGTVLQDNVKITQKTPIVQEPTPLNRATFANMQGDLYTSDRYNKPVVVEGIKQSEIFNTNLFDGLEAINTQTCENSKVKVTCSGTSSDSALINAFDGTEDGQWKSNTSTSTYLRVECKNATKITKLYISATVSGAYIISAVIQGSNDGVNWDDLYSFASSISSVINLNNPNYYYYYKVSYTNSVSIPMTIKELRVTEWQEQFNIFINNLSLPLTSYEVGKIVNIEGNDFILEEENYIEEHFTSDIIPNFKIDGMLKTTITDKYGTWEIPNTAYCSVYDKTDTTGYQTTVSSTSGYTYIKSVMSSDYKRFAIKPSKIRVVGKSLNYTTIQGVKLDGTVENIGAFVTNTGSFDTTIDISTQNYYTEFRYSHPTSGGTGYLYSFEIIEGDIRYGVLQDEKVSSFDKPYLNINNLGAKQINGKINSGAKYSLTYNGESWDIVENYAIGSYTGDGEASRFINLGFTPKAVLLVDRYGTMNDNGAERFLGGLATQSTPVVSNYNSGLSNVLDITENGFNVYYNTKYRCDSNRSNWVFNYIAFKWN